MKKINFLKKAASLALVTTFAASISACGSRADFNTGLDMDQMSSFGTTRTDAAKKKWTFLVHLAADNNLYGFGLKDMSEMAYGLTSTDVNVVVLFDGARTGDSGIYEIKHSDKKPAMNAPITSPKVANPIVPASNELDSGDPKVFADFMDWATKTYPAERTAVVIWNHGDGIFRNGQTFRPKNSKQPIPGQVTSNGFAWDDHGGNMNLKDLGPAFSRAMSNTGKKLDILDFDACLMSHVESAYQVKDQVSYLVASEMVEAGDGNDYLGIMRTLSANPDMNGAQFASAMVDGYAKSYLPGGNQYTGRKEEYTLSATDTSALANGLVPAINGLADELSKNLSTAKSARTMTATYENADSADLGHFAKLVAKDQRAGGKAQEKANALLTELKKTVIREVHSDQSVISSSTGLVIYFPEPGDSLNPKYTNPAEIKFAEQPNWANFLKAFTKSSR